MLSHHDRSSPAVLSSAHATPPPDPLPLASDLASQGRTMNISETPRADDGLPHEGDSTDPSRPQSNLEKAAKLTWSGRGETLIPDVEADASEAKGRGTYSLHAVLGQGSFGRIHLASWRASGEGPLRGGGGHPVPAPRAFAPCKGANRAGAAVGPRRQQTASQRPRRATPSSVSRVAGRVSLLDSLGMTSFVEDCSGALLAVLGETRLRHRLGNPSQTPQLEALLPPSPPSPRPPLAGPSEGDEGGGFPQRSGVFDARAGDAWRWDPPAPRRLCAIKSVCKRKVTEKGLSHHMETVRGDGSGNGDAVGVFPGGSSPRKV